MEMLLAGTGGGCTAFDVVAILKKGRHAITGCEVSLSAERAEHEPKVSLEHTYRRLAEKPQARRRGTRHELSKDKYCSASIMLGKTAMISHDFEIVED